MTIRRRLKELHQPTRHLTGQPHTNELDWAPDGYWCTHCHTQRWPCETARIARIGRREEKR